MNDNQKTLSPPSRRARFVQWLTVSLMIALIFTGYSAKEVTGQIPPTTTEPDFKPFLKMVGTAPDWLAPFLESDKDSSIDPESGDELLLVMSEPLLHQLEAEQDLNDRLLNTVRDRIDDQFGAGAAKAIGVDLNYIREHLVERNSGCDPNGVYLRLFQWQVSEANRDTVGEEVRDAFQCCSLLRFDEEFRSWSKSEWENRLVLSRTLQTGLYTFGALALLSLVFGYFFAEHKTRGFYSRRLQTGVLVFLAGIGGLFWWLSTRFPWL